jgi:hypothetical protein
MAIVLSAMLVMFTNNVALDQTSRNLTTAASHADAILEAIRNATSNFSQLCSDINSGNWSTTAKLPTGFSPLNSESIATTTTTASVNCPNASLLTVTTAINWKDLQQRAQVVNWTTQVGY